MKPKFRTGLIAGSLLFGAVSGCATAPVNERTESTGAAIRAAEEVGANKVPRASLYLQLAKEESERAKALSTDGDKDRAASLLLRAEADADLAVALSRESAEKADAAQAMDRVHELQKANK